MNIPFRPPGLQVTREIKTTLRLPTLHLDQCKAYWDLQPHRFKVLRCGRRWGKTDYGKVWIGDALARGWECAWFAPHHKTWSEAYMEMRDTFRPIISGGSKGEQVMRFETGGRLDFWTLENPQAGRSRRYRRIVIDEGAFGKDEPSDGNVMDIWELSIKPTLFDYGGEALVCSNSAGKNPDNFLYRICTDEKFGFHEYHAPTSGNDRLPKRMPGETPKQWLKRREQFLEELKRDNDPLVYAQEYGAEFVDWAGVAFFAEGKLLQKDGTPWPMPKRCDAVFAVVDSATKTGNEHDGTAVIFYALDVISKKLWIVDWDIVQIEGALLETWLPGIFKQLAFFAEELHARNGSIGTWIEDKSSGMVLLQQAKRREWPAQAIESDLTAVGKDERAISVSGYVYRDRVGICAPAYHKTVKYKRDTRNQLISQVCGFRLADPDANKREDDLLDCFCYGIAIALGNHEGF